MVIRLLGLTRGTVRLFDDRKLHSLHYQNLVLVFGHISHLLGHNCLTLDMISGLELCSWPTFRSRARSPSQGPPHLMETRFGRPLGFSYHILPLPSERKFIVRNLLGPGRARSIRSVVAHD